MSFMLSALIGLSYISLLAACRIS
ncbi:uncharacterized protein FFB20_01314 [Fusarium fujikuroi]|nr:uncharacterized protein FFB20_01314 [Fusarium fujikuroi]SCO13116.1 uncharacterized protein FFC1_11980 [Fusarium fujikuroi]